MGVGGQQRACIQRLLEQKLHCSQSTKAFFNESPSLALGRPRQTVVRDFELSGLCCAVMLTLCPVIVCRGARLSFSFVYPDRRGQNVMKEVREKDTTVRMVSAGGC